MFASDREKFVEFHGRFGAGYIGQSPNDQDGYGEDTTGMSDSGPLHFHSPKGREDPADPSYFFIGIHEHIGRTDKAPLMVKSIGEPPFPYKLIYRLFRPAYEALRNRKYSGHTGNLPRSIA
jgi:hypothetical protein